MTNKRITPPIAAVLAIAGILSTIAAANHDDAENLRDQVATLTQQRDAARSDMAGQVEINAQYADQIADLKADLTAAKKAHKKTPAPKLRMYEDGSWVMGKDSGCAPSALCDDEYQDSLIEHVPSGLATWEGFRVGEVILCPKGWDVSVDDADDGQTWAACM